MAIIGESSENKTYINTLDDGFGRPGLLAVCFPLEITAGIIRRYQLA